MVAAPYPRNHVFVEEPLDGHLRLGVVLHERHVQCVDEEQQSRLPPLDEVVFEEDYQEDQGEGVEAAVTEKWPPGEVEDGLGEHGAHPDDEEDVEDRGPDDRADTDVAERYENSDRRSEQFRC